MTTNLELPDAWNVFFDKTTGKYDLVDHRARCFEPTPEKAEQFALLMTAAPELLLAAKAMLAIGKSGVPSKATFKAGICALTLAIDQAEGRL